MMGSTHPGGRRAVATVALALGAWAAAPQAHATEPAGPSRAKSVAEARAKLIALTEPERRRELEMLAARVQLALAALEGDRPQPGSPYRFEDLPKAQRERLLERLFEDARWIVELVPAAKSWRLWAAQYARGLGGIAAGGGAIWWALATDLTQDPVARLFVFMAGIPVGSISGVFLRLQAEDHGKAHAQARTFRPFWDELSRLMPGQVPAGAVERYLWLRERVANLPRFESPDVPGEPAGIRVADEVAARPANEAPQAASENPLEDESRVPPPCAKRFQGFNES